MVRELIEDIYFSERAEDRLRDHILKFEKKLEDLQKDVDIFRRKDVCENKLVHPLCFYT